MKRLLWVSQHKVHPSQFGALRRMFGQDVQVTSDPRPFSSAEDIVQRYKQGGYDDLIVVAPLSVLARMVDLGIRPLWAEAEQVSDPSQSDWSVRNRYYRFLRFQRVKRVALELEPLGPDAERQLSDLY